MRVMMNGAEIAPVPLYIQHARTYRHCGVAVARSKFWGVMSDKLTRCIHAAAEVVAGFKGCCAQGGAD